MRDVVAQYNIVLVFNSNPPFACGVEPDSGSVKPKCVRPSVDVEHTVQEANQVFPRQVISEHGDRNAGREDGPGGARDFEASQERIPEREGARDQRNQCAMQAKRNAPTLTHHNVQHVHNPQRPGTMASGNTRKRSIGMGTLSLNRNTTTQDSMRITSTLGTVTPAM